MKAQENNVEFFLIITGVVMGILSGMLGVGGGIILVPALIFLMKVEPHRAIGISLAVIIPTALSGAFKHYRNGNVDLRIAILVAVGAIAGAYLGATIANTLPGGTLKKIFGGFLIVMGFNMLFEWTSKLTK